MDKRQILEQEIFVTIQKIDECDRVTRLAKDAIKKSGKLRGKLEDLMRKYLNQSLKDTLGEEEKRTTVLFKFNGKNKDLLQKLRQELEKANS